MATKTQNNSHEAIEVSVPKQSKLRSPKADCSPNEGICATCKHREGCVYAQADAEAIQFCEEFETQEAPETSASPSTNPVKAPDGRGLCVTCAQRDGCTHCDLEAGIWHCEEFC